LVIGDEHVAKLGCLSEQVSCRPRAAVLESPHPQRAGQAAKNVRAQVKLLLRMIPYAESWKAAFARWCGKRGGRDAARLLDDDRKRIVTLYVFSQEHWKHLRTSNSVESPFEVIGLRTTAAKRYKKVDRATAIIWKTLLIARTQFLATRCARAAG